MNLKKIILITCAFFTVLFSVILFGVYQRTLKKNEEIEDFNNERALILEQSAAAKTNTLKSQIFIEDHLPFKLNNIIISQEINSNASGEEHTLYQLEETLLNQDVDGWLSYFSSGAITNMMNQIESVKLNDRIAELSIYLRHITRGDLFLSLASYEFNGEIYVVFQYTDGLEVEMPLSFTKIEGNDMLIDTDIMEIIDKVEQVDKR